MTIEERAYDYAIEEARVEGFDFDSVEDGYIKGARDQRKIDIDKACEWLISELGDTKLAYPRPELDGEWVGCFVEDFIDNFRKAMEE